MKNTTRIIIVSFCLIFTALTSYGQADAILRSKKIVKKINIKFDFAKTDKFEYLIDNDYRNPDSKRLNDPLSLVATDESFKVMMMFLNPLKYAVTVDETSEEDPNIKSINQFLVVVKNV